MPDLEVNVDGLADLSATVKRIQTGLNNTKDDVAHLIPSLGSGDVADALNHFQSHWHDGRKHINDNADAMVGMLDQSVQSYTKADGDLKKSVTSNTKSSQIGAGKAS